MRNETGSNQLPYQDSEIRGYGVHSVLKVVIQLSSVVVHVQYLVTQMCDIENVLVSHLLQKVNERSTEHKY